MCWDLTGEPVAEQRERLEHCVRLLRPRVPPRLHPALAQDQVGLPAVQQGVGVRQDRADSGLRNSGSVNTPRERQFTAEKGGFSAKVIFQAPAVADFCVQKKIPCVDVVEKRNRGGQQNNEDFDSKASGTVIYKTMCGGFWAVLRWPGQAVLDESVERARRGVVFQHEI